MSICSNTKLRAANEQNMPIEHAKSCRLFRVALSDLQNFRLTLSNSDLWSGSIELGRLIKDPLLLADLELWLGSSLSLRQSRIVDNGQVATYTAAGSKSAWTNSGSRGHQLRLMMRCDSTGCIAEAILNPTQVPLGQAVVFCGDPLPASRNELELFGYIEPLKHET